MSIKHPSAVLHYLLLNNTHLNTEKQNANKHLSAWITCRWKFKSKPQWKHCCLHLHLHSAQWNGFQQKWTFETGEGWEEFVEEGEKQHANLWQLKDDVTVWRPHAGNPLLYCPDIKRAWIDQTVSLQLLGHMSQDHFRIVLLSYHVLVMLGLQRSSLVKSWESALSIWPYKIKEKETFPALLSYIRSRFVLIYMSVM